MHKPAEIAYDMNSVIVAQYAGAVLSTLVSIVYLYSVARPSALAKWHGVRGKMCEVEH